MGAYAVGGTTDALEIQMQTLIISLGPLRSTGEVHDIHDGP